MTLEEASTDWSTLRSKATLLLVVDVITGKYHKAVVVHTSRRLTLPPGQVGWTPRLHRTTSIFTIESYLHP
uniref:Uncharacterized protein n=1 Tax=Oryza glumipatula TaxID=40148 RepID=A0A0E0A6B1_9ORYZ